MSEVSDALQMIVISGRFFSATANLGAKALMMLAKTVNTIYLAKWQGKSTFNRLRAVKGEDMVFINASTENRRILKSIEKEMKKHHIMFAKMPDLCGGDGRTQYAIAASDIAKLKAFMLDHLDGKHGRVAVGPIKVSDYVKTGYDMYGNPTPELQALQNSAMENVLNGQKQQEQPQPVIFREVVPTEVDAGVREYVARNNPQCDVFVREPISGNENWMMFGMPDGKHGIVVPSEDVFGARDGGIGFAVYMDRDYQYVDLSTSSAKAIKGRGISGMMALQNDIYKENADLKDIFVREPEELHANQKVLEAFAAFFNRKDEDEAIDDFMDVVKGGR